MSSKDKSFKEGFMEGVKVAGTILLESAGMISRKAAEGIAEAGILGASYSAEFGLTPTEQARLNMYHAGKGNIRQGVLSPSPSAGQNVAAGGGGGGPVASVQPFTATRVSALPSTSAEVLSLGTHIAPGTFSRLLPPREENTESTAATAGAPNRAAVARAAKAAAQVQREHAYPGYTGAFTKDGRPNMRTIAAQQYMEKRQGGTGELQGGGLKSRRRRVKRTRSRRGSRAVAKHT
jgi:hypothetical protein